MDAHHGASQKQITKDLTVTASQCKTLGLGGFDLASGKRMGFSGGTQHLQDYKLSVSSDGRLFVLKPESHHLDDPNPGTPHYLNLDYELHQGTILDYLSFESSKMREGSKIQL